MSAPPQPKLFIMNGKKIEVGDSIVFVKDSAQNLILGIRRKRSLTGNVTESSLLEAVHLAKQKTAFEVECFPPNFTDFVVDAKVVEDAMKVAWDCGKRVKVIQKVESKKLQPPEGTILGVSDVLTWRMLQVNWEKSEISHNPNNVNPWHVEVIYPAPETKGLVHGSRSFKLFGKNVRSYSLTKVIFMVLISKRG